MPRRSLVLWIAAAALAALATSGCGVKKVRHVTTTITVPAANSSSSSSGSTSATSPSSASSSTSTSTAGASTPAPSQVSGRSPHAIVVAAAHALQNSGGYTMRADLTQNGDRSVVALTANGPHTYQATLTDKDAISGMVALPAASYLRGNRAFWDGEAGSKASPARQARAARLAGHWLKLTDQGANSLAKSLGSLAPSVLARCLIEDHGTLSVAGHTTIGHTGAVIIKDAGNAPGATPSTIAVAANGPPYPLRYTATGASRRGGKIDVCNNGKGSDSEGTIDFSQFGQVPTIQAPTGAAGGGTTI